MNELTFLQNQAVTYPLGRHIYVQAGPGAGKTRVIAFRTKYLIESQVLPSAILALSFSNYAVAQLTRRIELIAETQEVTVCTFHSLAYRILRAHAHRLNISNFRVLSQTEQLAILQDIIDNDLHLDENTFKAYDVAQVIDHYKRNGLRAEDILEDSTDPWFNTTKTIYQQYEQKCQRWELIDFTELQFLAYELLQFPDIRELYQNQWSNILVDEFQDLEPLQLAILLQLVSTKNTLFAVGDKRQQIYGFRGAKQSTVTRFQDYFPNAVILALTDNFRNGSAILRVAESALQSDETPMTVQAKHQSTVYCYKAQSVEDESHFIAKEIQACLARKIPASKIAVLYRTHKQGIQIASVLDQYHIDYKLKSNKSYDFNERIEIKDCLAYLSVLINPNDDFNLLRIINRPKRGIGATIIKALKQIALVKDCTIWQTCTELLHNPDFIKNPLKPRQLKKIAQFVELVQNLKNETTQNKSLVVILQTLLEKTGLQEYYARDALKMDSLQELSAKINRFETQNPRGMFVEFLNQHVISDNHSNIDLAVQMMPLHSSKGLEFHTTFLVGLQDDLLPHKNVSDIAEEARLLFVGMTRPSHTLYLSYTEARLHKGQFRSIPPSRFLKNIPAALLTPLVTNTLPALTAQGESRPAPSLLDRKQRLSGQWLNTSDFARRYGLYVQSARKILHKAYAQGISWRGCYLDVKIDAVSQGYLVNRHTLPKPDKMAELPTLSGNVTVAQTEDPPFIDFISLNMPIPVGLPPINDGCVVYLDSQGQIQKTIDRRLVVEGSYSTKTLLKAANGRLDISGNIGRYNRRDNVFNYGLPETIAKINQLLDLPEFTHIPRITLGTPRLTNKKQYKSGGYSEYSTIVFDGGARLSRLDLTKMYSLDSEQSKRIYLQYLSTLNLPYKHTSAVYGASGQVETIYFDKTSTYLTIKIYDKAVDYEKRNREHLHNGKARTPFDSHYEKVLNFLKEKNIIRVEIVLKRDWLIQTSYCWLGAIMNDLTALQQIYKEQTSGFLSDIDVNKTAVLSRPARVMFYEWMSGEVLAETHSRATIYRHRKEIKEKLGQAIDITRPCPDPKQVIPKTHVCKITPISMPDWYHLPPIAV